MPIARIRYLSRLSIFFIATKARKNPKVTCSSLHWRWSSLLRTPINFSLYLFLASCRCKKSTLYWLVLSEWWIGSCFIPFHWRKAGNLQSNFGFILRSPHALKSSICLLSSHLTPHSSNSSAILAFFSFRTRIGGRAFLILNCRTSTHSVGPPFTRNHGNFEFTSLPSFIWAFLWVIEGRS